MNEFGLYKRAPIKFHETHRSYGLKFDIYSNRKLFTTIPKTGVKCPCSKVVCGWNLPNLLKFSNRISNAAASKRCIWCIRTRAVSRFHPVDLISAHDLPNKIRMHRQGDKIRVEYEFSTWTHSIEQSLNRNVTKVILFKCSAGPKKKH